MLSQIKGLHHVTSLASSAAMNNAFFTSVLGLNRVKKTVNFDRPNIYHLYYGDHIGTPGTVMTYFPYGVRSCGSRGTGEVGSVSFSIPHGSIDAWTKRLSETGVKNLKSDVCFGAKRLTFSGPDGDALALVETPEDYRIPWTEDGVSEEMAIRGFHSVNIPSSDIAKSAELLQFMGYERLEKKDNITRFVTPDGNGADCIDLENLPNAKPAIEGAGSVHHLAFAVENRARQLEVREALLDTGYVVTPVIDRDYFWAIYFRTPDGVLFEIATNEPGFDTDEDTASLGQSLKLPAQHEHLRGKLVRTLEPIDN